MLDKIKLNRKLLKEIDYGILISIILIVIFGILNVYSATHIKSGTHFLRTQTIWLIAGLFVVYCTLVIDYMLLKNFASVFYWASIILLILNDTILKKTVNGASSWMQIGGFAFQPSELAKLTMILMLAKVLDDMEGTINEPKNFFKLCFYAALPMVLIVIQPDMGMTMVCFFIVLGIFFIAGLDLKIIGGGLLSLAGLVAIIWNSPLMQPYWRTRLTSVFNPEADELGAGLQLGESLKGIGSGGVFGKGFLKGTQISGGFIPESHTDFIFSVVGEEWGLIGGIGLLILYGIVIYRMIIIAKTSKDKFGTMVAVGIISTTMFSVIQNIGMTIGIMPITGITLPFMSAGGSSMLTNFMAIALVLNIGMRRKKINF